LVHNESQDYFDVNRSRRQWARCLPTAMPAMCAMQRWKWTSWLQRMSQDLSYWIHVLCQRKFGLRWQSACKTR